MIARVGAALVAAMAALAVGVVRAAPLPPAAAVDYFKQKGLKVSDNWYDILDAVHSKVFTVANGLPSNSVAGRPKAGDPIERTM